MRTLALFLTLFLVCVSASDDYAGMKFGISRKTIKHFTDTVVPNFVRHFKPIYVPQVFNRFYVQISEITIAKMILPSDAFDGYFEDNNLVLFTDDVTVAMAMIVTIDLPFYKKPILMNVTCENSGLVGTMGFSYLNGYPLFEIKDLQVDLRNINLQFNGTLMSYVGSAISSLLNLSVIKPVADFLADQLKSKIVAATNEKFYHMFDNSTLYTAAYAVSLDLIDTAVLEDEYISVAIDGTAYETAKGKEELPVPKGVELPEFNHNSTGEMQLFVSEYTINTVLYKMWEAGKFAMKISTDKPKSDSFAMKLAWVREYVVGITNMFGGSNTNIVVEMDCLEAPKMAFSKDKIHFKAHFNYSVYAKYQDTKFKVYQSDSPYDVATDLHETNMTLNLLNPQIRQENFNFSVLNTITNVAGQFELLKLQDIANSMIVAMFKKMNFITTIGDLPDLIDVNKTTISFEVHNGYMQFSVNPEFIVREDVAFFDLDFKDKEDYEPHEIQYFTFEDNFAPKI